MIALCGTHFEHFDERIEDAVATGVTVDASIFPKGAIEVGGATQPSQSYLRNFDPQTRRLTFWHDEFDVDAVASELIRIGRLAVPTPSRTGHGLTETA